MPRQDRSIRRLIRFGHVHLRRHGVRRSMLDAELLLATVLDRDKVYLIAHGDDEVTATQAEKYLRLLEHRAGGTPVQYLRGIQEFWGRDFKVTPDVLIPRPETELIIEQAIGWRHRMPNDLKGTVLRIGDIGAGSGCLAVTLAAEISDSAVYATDISAQAIEVGRYNASRHNVEDRVHFLCGDLAEPLLKVYGSSSFHLVVCNPPYGAENDPQMFEREVVEHEPYAALFGGPEGTEVIERLVPQVLRLLTSGGVFLLEIGAGQSERVEAFFGTGWGTPYILPDLQGIPRCLSCHKTG